MSDQLLPQPPPDAPAPPPGEVAMRSKRKLGAIIVGGLSLLVLSPLMLSPFAPRAKIYHLSDPISDLRQLFIPLYLFNEEYGTYPDSSTIAEVARKTGTSLTLGDSSSNELFTQLLVTGFGDSEAIFYGHSKSARKPDKIFTSDATALAPGECSLAYITWPNVGENSVRPIVFGPVIPGTRDLDAKSFKGEAVVLFSDGNVEALNIDASGRIIASNGLDILDPRQPYWNGRIPDVKWPR